MRREVQYKQHAAFPNTKAGSTGPTHLHAMCSPSICRICANPNSTCRSLLPGRAGGVPTCPAKATRKISEHATSAPAAPVSTAGPHSTNGQQHHWIGGRTSCKEAALIRYMVFSQFGSAHSSTRPACPSGAHRQPLDPQHSPQHLHRHPSPSTWLPFHAAGPALAAAQMLSL